MVLPVDVLARESGQLGDSQAGVEQCPNNDALLVGLTCCGQAVCFVWGQGFAFGLVGHIQVIKADGCACSSSAPLELFDMLQLSPKDCILFGGDNC